MNLKELDGFIAQFEGDRTLFLENPNDDVIRHKCDQTREDFKRRLNESRTNQNGTGHKVWEIIKDLSSTERNLCLLYDKGLPEMKRWASRTTVK